MHDGWQPGDKDWHCTLSSGQCEKSGILYKNEGILNRNLTGLWKRLERSCLGKYLSPRKLWYRTVIKLDPYLTLLIKINSKWIKKLNVRSETLNILEENIWKHSFILVLSKNFLDMIPKAQPAKAKSKQMDYIKFKSFLHSKIINKIKKQPTNRGEYLQAIQ